MFEVILDHFPADREDGFDRDRLLQPRLDLGDQLVMSPGGPTHVDLDPSPAADGSRSRPDGTVGPSGGYG